MMYGCGGGTWWMTLTSLVWIALIAAVVWAVARLVRPDGRPVGHRPAGQSRETPQEILDRRYALGEIDDDAYRAARAVLSGRETGRS